MAVLYDPTRVATSHEMTEQHWHREDTVGRGPVTDGLIPRVLDRFAGEQIVVLN